MVGPHACLVQVHGRIRRYTSPDEYAFFPEDLPALVLPPITYEQVRHWLTGHSFRHARQSAWALAQWLWQRAW
jgi:hypothetical protein